MRRGILGALAVTMGLVLMAPVGPAGAEPASAVSFVTGVKGTAMFDGPVGYAERECLSRGLLFDCSRWSAWTDPISRTSDWTLTTSLACYVVCFGQVRIAEPLGPFVMGNLFVGSASASGSRVTIGGTVIRAGGFLSFSDTSLTVVLDHSTGTAGASWPNGAPVFHYDGELSLHMMQFRDVQMSGTLVSGNINVSGF